MMPLFALTKPAFVVEDVSLMLPVLIVRKVMPAVLSVISEPKDNDCSLEADCWNNVEVPSSVAFVAPEAAEADMGSFFVCAPDGRPRARTEAIAAAT